MTAALTTEARSMKVMDSQELIGGLATLMRPNHPSRLAIGSTTTLSPCELASIFLPNSTMVIKEETLTIEDSEAAEGDNQTFSLRSQVLVCVDDSDNSNITILTIGATQDLDGDWLIHHVSKEDLNPLYSRDVPMLLTQMH